MNAKPIVKWAGGKRQLINKLIKYMPLDYNEYFEPFVGGGALLFELMPEHAVINDANKELISIYKCLANKECFESMLKDLNKHEENHSEDYYYKTREEDRKPSFDKMTMWEKASRTLYLNKSCYNGLYRVNSKNFFNVPSGKKIKVNTYDKDNIVKIHNYFINKNIKILNCDFVEAVASAKSGDFVYFDPPYDPIKKETFTAYTKSDFTKEDQIRLSLVYKQLSDKGVHVMLSNHNTELINELYKDFNIYIVKARRSINSNGQGRRHVEEVIITNY